MARREQPRSGNEGSGVVAATGAIPTSPVDADGARHVRLDELVVIGHQLIALAERDLQRLLELERAMLERSGIVLDVLAGHVEHEVLAALNAKIALTMGVGRTGESGEQRAEEIGEQLGIDRRSVGYLATKLSLKANGHLFDRRSKKYTALGVAILTAAHQARRPGIAAGESERPSFVVLPHVLAIVKQLNAIGDRMARVERDVRRRAADVAPVKKRRRKVRRSGRHP